LAAVGFRDLRVWQQAVALSDDVAHRIASWPPFERSSIGLQLVRAAESIGANIAEGAGRATRADKRRLYVMVPPGASRMTDELARTLNGLIRTPVRA
jgi:hypothetical protein